jgi:secreted trypsin-like serine protease
LTLTALCLLSPAAGASTAAARPARVRVRAAGIERIAARRLTVRARAAIIGGTAARGPLFASLALVVDFRPGEGVAVCSGTVVAPDVVLTAAHCVVNRDTGETWPTYGYEVQTHTTLAGSPGTLVSDVTRVLVDPSFDRSTVAYDAALLILSTPTSAPPVKLPPAGAVPLAGTQALVAGWGETAYGANVSRRLRAVATIVRSEGWCSTSVEGFETRSELCAMHGITSRGRSCKGDSGGPLLVRGRNGPVEIGIISQGWPHCSPEGPMIMTDTSAVSGWVGATLRGEAQLAAAAASLRR